jgi:hypothetical protein
MLSRSRVLLSVLVSLGFPLILVAADVKTPPARLSAAQIVEKHVAARGGLQAWRAVRTLSWTGKMDAGVGDSAARSALYVKNMWGHGAKAAKAAAGGAGADKAAAAEKAPAQVQLPFVLEMKRPGKSRVEIQFAGKTAVQVYDGTNGWKVRPFLNRKEVEPFTPQEAKAQASQGELDGLLMDYAVKGTKVELDGVEPVEGRNAYKLKLTMKNGDVRHVWIDVQSFLDVKVEGTPRRMDGRMRTVWVYQRDFRSVQGVMVPFLLETAVEGYSDTHKMILEKVALNPPLDDALFAKPTA